MYELAGSNEFMWLKPGLKVLTFFWNLQLRFVRRFLALFNDKTLNQNFYLSQVETKRLLVVWREFNGSNDWALRVIAEKFRARLGDGTLLEIQTRQGKVFTKNNRWLCDAVVDSAATHLVVLDAHLLGFPTPVGLLQARKLGLILRNLHVSLNIVMFDLPEPHMLSNILVLQKYLNCGVHLMCSAASEGNSFGLRNVFGPDIALLSRDIAEGNTPFQLRKIDVHLARPNYEPRRSMISYISKQLAEFNLNVMIGGTSPTPEDFRKSLENTKIAVVTNRIITPGPIGRWPLPSGPSKHAVSYNAEAIESGCLLISEQCDALDALFEPNVDYVPYQDIADVAGLVKEYLANSEKSQEIIDSAQRKLIKLRADTEIGLWS